MSFKSLCEQNFWHLNHYLILHQLLMYFVFLEKHMTILYKIFALIISVWKQH